MTPPSGAAHVPDEELERANSSRIGNAPAHDFRQRLTDLFAEIDAGGIEFFEELWIEFGAALKLRLPLTSALKAPRIACSPTVTSATCPARTAVSTW